MWGLEEFPDQEIDKYITSSNSVSYPQTWRFLILAQYPPLCYKLLKSNNPSSSRASIHILTQSLSLMLPMIPNLPTGVKTTPACLV